MSSPLQSGAPELISNEEFDLVADLLKQKTGIHIEMNKRAMVSGRLAKRLKVLGLPSITAYREFLCRSGNEAEEDAFISALTTNMTRFNREDHHFTHLCARILPELAKAARSGKRVRLWSAGCSTGEEAYDLAFRVLETFPDALQHDVRILASDIDKTALEAARAGVYPRSCLSDFPNTFAERFFEKRPEPGGMVRVAQPPRDLITFRWLNLNADWPFHGQFDVIMCRNVTIYFDSATQERLWTRFADRIQHNGALYIGHSEMLPDHIADRFVQEERGAFFRATPVNAQTMPQPIVRNGAHP